MHPRNIILVTADDMGYGDPGVYGSTAIPTPSIDRIAHNGVRFTDMHSSAAVCTPSRYSMLTGRYCWRTWLTRSVLGGFGSPLIESGRPTIASILRDAGYATAAVGKWHLGLNWWTTGGTRLDEIKRDGVGIDGFDVDYERGFTGGPLDCGFDRWFGMSGSLDMPPYCMLEGRFPTEIPRREKAPYRSQQRVGLMSEKWDDEIVDDLIRERACSEVRAAAKDAKPLFLYVATSAPHRPCLPPAHAHGRSAAGPRGDMVSHFDRTLGEIVATLESVGCLKDTLLIVTSDHGARTTDAEGRDWRHRSNGFLRGQKGDIYEGGHRVPCVAQWPRGFEAGQVCEELLCQNDFFPTICAAANIQLSGRCAPDGRSFLDILTSPTAARTPIHDSVVHHSMDGMFAIRNGPWKAIFGRGSGGMSEPRRYSPEPGELTTQLYNLENDLGEQLNLASSHPDIVSRLQDELGRIRTAETT